MKKNAAQLRKSLKSLLSQVVTPRQLELAMRGSQTEIYCRVGNDYSIDGQPVTKEEWEESLQEAESLDDGRLIIVNLITNASPDEVESH